MRDNERMCHSKQVEDFGQYTIYKYNRELNEPVYLAYASEGEDYRIQASHSSLKILKSSLVAQRLRHIKTKK